MQVVIIDDDRFVKSFIGDVIFAGMDAQIMQFPSVESIESSPQLGKLLSETDLFIVDIFLAGDRLGSEFILKYSDQLENKCLVYSGIQNVKVLGKYESLSDRFLCLHKEMSPEYIRSVVTYILKHKTFPLSLTLQGPQKIRSLQEIRQSKPTPTILITGASSGIGRALARLMLTNDRYKIILTARAGSLESIRSEFGGHKNVQIFELDLVDGGQISSAITKILAEYESIDVLINVAGICFRSSVEHMDHDSEERQMATNYSGPLALIRAILPGMREAGRGKIINVSSASGVLGMPTMGSYAASKHALEGASEALWYETWPYGISVTVVRPGFVNSESYKRVVMSKKSELGHHPGSAYADYYSFMGSLVSRLMSLAASSEVDIAKKIMRVVTTQNPPLWINATLDAKIIDFTKRFLPASIFQSLFRQVFSLVGRVRQSPRRRAKLTRSFGRTQRKEMANGKSAHS